MKVAIAAPERRRRRIHVGVPQSRGATAAVLQAPSILLLAAVAVFPVLYSINLSFRAFSLILVGVTIELTLGIALAVVIDSLKVGRRLLTSLLLIPMILTPLVIGLMYNFLFNAQFGLLTYLIRS